MSGLPSTADRKLGLRSEQLRRAGFRGFPWESRPRLAASKYRSSTTAHGGPRQSRHYLRINSQNRPRITIIPTAIPM